MPITLPVLGELDTTTLAITGAIILLAYVYLSVKLRPKAVRFKRARRFDVKAVPVEGTERDGQTPEYKSKVPMMDYGSVHTLHDNFLAGWRKSKNSPCLGIRPVDKEGNAGAYEWVTYDEVKTRCDNFGSGAMNLGLAPISVDPEAKGMRFMGFYSKNCAEWVIAAQACNKFGVVVVPLYDTLGVTAVKYVVNQTQMTTLCCTAAEVNNVMAVAKQCPCLKNIVLMSTADPASDAKFEAEFGRPARGVTVHRFADVESSGKASPADAPIVDPRSVATFCYTSGTTGDPKGAMLTHDNIITGMFGAMSVGINTTADDVHISYLPLAHMFERIVQEALFHNGARIGFYQGHTLKLLADIGALRPTIFPSVPRLYNKIYDKVMAGAMAGGIKTLLFKMALAAKIKGLRQGYLEHPLWDKLVFSKVGKKVGLDRCRLMITGSAPIAPHVMDFLRVAFICPVQEGYGQTESAAAATLTFADDYSVGHVGGPISCNTIKLVDVEDMGYLATDTEHNGQPCMGRGEICFKGRNIFVGYYKNAAKTAEAVDEDGWLHSGDIGLWTPKGELRIVDRKKNIFKLSQGEYVAAEKIENVHAGGCKFVAQNYVYGDSLHSFLLAVVVPDHEILLPWAKANNLPEDMAKLCAMPKVNEMILAEMREVATAKGLHGFEKVRAVYLEPELWTAENGILTPTFKLKRNVAKKKYLAEFNRMYDEAGSHVGGVKGLRQE